MFLRENMNKHRRLPNTPTTNSTIESHLGKRGSKYPSPPSSLALAAADVLDSIAESAMDDEIMNVLVELVVDDEYDDEDDEEYFWSL